MSRITFELFVADTDAIVDAIDTLKSLLPISKVLAERGRARFAVAAPIRAVGISGVTDTAPTADPKAEQKAEDVKPPETYSGAQLRKLAADKAKVIGADKVKAFVAELGVKSIADVAPEDSAAVKAKLDALV